MRTTCQLQHIAEAPWMRSHAMSATQKIDAFKCSFPLNITLQLSPSSHQVSEVSFLMPSPYEMLSHFSQYDSTNTGTTSTSQRLNGTGD